MEPSRPRHRAVRRSVGTLIVDLVSGLCLLACVFTGYQVAWQYWGAGLDTATVSRQIERAQKTEFETVTHDKTAPLREEPLPRAMGEPSNGDLFAYLRLPRLGVDYRKPIQEGTGLDVLNNLGVGHYKGTAMPGGKGNMALAGHATLDDFGRINRLQPGDDIIIETGDMWIVYHVTSSRIVDKTAVEVIAPQAAGVERGVTLTTCWPVFVVQDPPQRYIVHGQYAGWIPKEDGMPASLASEHRTPGEHVKRVVETVGRRVGLPVTGVMGLGLLAIWLILSVMVWIPTRKAWWKNLRAAPASWSPLTLLWRVQPTPFPARPRIRAVGRTLMLFLLLAALMFLSWRWACPWVAQHVPFLATPHPQVE